MGLVAQFDDPLTLGGGSRLTDDPNPPAGQGMMGVNDADISRGCARLGGILLRTIPCDILIQPDIRGKTSLQRRLIAGITMTM